MPTYEIAEGCTWKITEEGERLRLANFIARIATETRFIDGTNVESSRLTIVGQMHDATKKKNLLDLPPIEIDSTSFAGMSWVMPSWGVRAIIQPGSSVKEDLRTAIQMYSTPEQKRVYKAMGWNDLGKGQRGYMHAGGAITKKGNDKSVTVQLPKELERYDITPNKEVDAKDAFKASLELTQLAKAEVGWVLWAATYAPLYGPVDFGTHLTGRSGTFKSELISLFQSHYGSSMDARHLPGSWSSTPNALEAQAYFAANAPFVIDDFVPHGTTWQQKTYQAAADKIIRAQGNQSGRARLTDISSLQTTMYPRGIVLSTGEDTPEGHSVRARMMIMEMTPGDVEPSKLSKAQANRELFKTVTYERIKDLTDEENDVEERATEVRNKNLHIGHTRTPPMTGKLIAVAEDMLDWGAEKGYITKQEATKRKKEANEAIVSAANKQQSYLETSDPVEIFQSALRQAMGAGLAHVRNLNGGIPRKPTLLGWTAENTHSDIPTYKSHGPCIGWIDWENDEMFIEANIGYNIAKKCAGQEMATTRQTLMKRLKDAGVLTRTDDARQRNTIRITAEGHPRQVVAMMISAILDTQEVPQDEEEERTDVGDAWEPDGNGNESQ